MNWCRVLGSFNVVLQSIVLGVSVHQVTLCVLGLQTRLRIYGTLQIDIGPQLDTVSPPVASYISGRGLCTDTCSLSVARNLAYSVHIAHTGLSGTGTFKSLWILGIHKEFHKASGFCYLCTWFYWWSHLHWT
jgi:hypothetical protein